MKNLTPPWIKVPIIFFIALGLVEYFIDSGDEPAFLKYPIIMLFLLLFSLILIAAEVISESKSAISYHSLDEEEKEFYDKKRDRKPRSIVWLKKTYLKLLGSKPIEEEHEIILDHNYDGIKELDNSLPPWWLYGFFITIIFAVIYLLKYHVFNGENQYDELKTEYVEAEKAIEEYKKTAPDLIDFNSVEILTDASDLENGKAIFDANCAACHKADGGGGIGPNLADEHWILGGGIKNVFKTISEGGRDGKGMIAWKQSLKASEIAQVASYLLKFQGTTPAESKAPEGDLWVE